MGATIQLQGSSIGGVTNADGEVKVKDIPNGEHVFIISFIGFKKQKITITFPRSDEAPLQILMDPEHEELEEVIITTTRSSRNIQNIPTRVEYIGGEELEEKITMQPGNIRMVLSESTGIQTQQTSASSANTTIRIQGLDGRYTQILKDGFPLYSGFSGGLSIMQIPPLDLKQVDLIKGSASTLYGKYFVSLGFTIAVSVAGVVLWGALVGSFLPFVLKKAGWDPASASAPFVATIVDITGLIIYFTVAGFFLHGTML